MLCWILVGIKYMMMDASGEHFEEFASDFAALRSDVRKQGLFTGFNIGIANGQCHGEWRCALIPFAAIQHTHFFGTGEFGPKGHKVLFDEITKGLFLAMVNLALKKGISNDHDGFLKRQVRHELVPHPFETK
jgi:hypothetical protein